MMNAIHALKPFFVEESGPTVVEYAVLLGLIIVIMIVIIAALGISVSGIFTNSQQVIETHVPNA